MDSWSAGSIGRDIAWRYVNMVSKSQAEKLRWLANEIDKAVSKAAESDTVDPAG